MDLYETDLYELALPQEPSPENAPAPEEKAAPPPSEPPAQDPPAPPQQPAPPPPQPAAFVQAGPPPREYRVGRLTLGLSLIAAGVLLLMGIFNPDFSIFVAAKFAPVILIFIGVEILISTFAARNRRLKYDFLSMFVCFLLIAGSFGLAIIPTIYQSTVVRERVQTQLASQVENQVYQAAQEEGIASVDCWLSLEGGLDAQYREDMTLSEVEGQLVYQSLRIRLDENFEDVASFAQKARQVLDRLADLELPGDTLELVQQDYKLSLSLSNAYQWDFSPEKLEALCESW